MKKLWLVLPLVMLFVISINLVGADFIINNNRTLIESDYFDGEFVSGRVGINFSEESNSKFESNFEGGIGLLDLLEEMGYVFGEDFNCYPSSCAKGYKANGGGSDEVEVEDGEAFGFKLEGEGIGSIDEIKFNISIRSDGPSCTNQLMLDFFGDGEFEFYNNFYSPGGKTCFKNYGCFDSSAEKIEANIRAGEENGYCEKIDNLPAGPAYKIGGKIKRVNQDSPLLKFTLHRVNSDNSTNLLGQCTIGPDDFSGGDFEEVDCIPLRSSETVSSIEGFDALVCVSATGETTGDYVINYEDDENKDLCGGGGNPQARKITYSGDYEIFAGSIEYASVGEGELNEESYENIVGRSLEEDVEDYLASNYGNNCGEEGCVVPIEFSGDSTMKVYAGKVRYVPNEGQGPSINKEEVYLLEKIEPKISTDKFIDLDIQKMQFEVPKRVGKHEFRLMFGGEEILEKEINVEVGFDFDIGPKFALIGRPINFRISGAEISSSKWEFGDGSVSVNSNNNIATHTYDVQGDFSIRVTASNSSGATSIKNFKIVVGDPKTSAARTITDYKDRMVKIKDEVSSYPSWINTILGEQIGIVSLDSTLKVIEEDYELLGQNALDEEYVEIVERLIELDIPYSISAIESGSLPIDIGFDKIDLNHIAKISNTQVGNRDEVISSLSSWLLNNYDASITFENVAAFKDSGEKGILKKYEIELRKKIGAGTVNSYLIIDVPLNSIRVGSTQELREISESGAVYFVVDEFSDQEVFEFLIIGETAPGILDLGVYLSPSLSDLGTSGKPYGGFVDQEGHFRWGLFIIAIMILLVVFLGIYIFLQSWYRRYYEKHLFKNPDDLYNLINFIYNSRKSGVDDTETRKKLKIRKWSNEQLTYAFRKIDGKRTGMWEIPLFKFAENNKVKQEIQKRNMGPIDTRFIKQPRY